MSNPDEPVGDLLGLPIPPDPQALERAGAGFLTRAFRASGALPADNAVARITHFTEISGGSTGRKALLSVEYARPDPRLHRDLFVKFSRDFDDVIRDRAKQQLEAEVRLALLSRTPEFPITVPACYGADYHRASGTGILITQRIPFGTGGIEPAYPKCRDYEMPDALEHYRVLLRAVGRLAGSHKAGRLADVARQFPFDMAAASSSDRIRYDERQLLNRVARYAEFAASFPQLLPSNVVAPQFLAQLAEQVPQFLRHERAIKTYLHSQPDFIALCHWNANVDNAWFWRDDRGELECGLLDWGRVGQMNVALALFGALSGAEIELWNERLDELLKCFADEMQRSGGPALDLDELEFQLMLFVAMMGLAWLFDAPALIRAQIPQLAQIESRFDPRFAANETARVQLHMLTNVLNLWQTRDFGRVLERFLEKSRPCAGLKQA